MGKGILGVIVGYLVMFALVFATFSGAYLAMGADVAFQPGNYEPSVLWLVTSFVLGFLAALVGGYVCAAISKSTKAPWVLAGLMIVLGLMMAAQMATADQPDPGPRTESVSNLDAMQKARQPLWVAVVNPFWGAIGLLLGARLRGKVSR